MRTLAAAWDSNRREALFAQLWPDPAQDPKLGFINACQAACQDSRDDYQRYIYDEYLAYRVSNLLTPYSYRVRLVEVTYEDVSGEYETPTKHGFLIEADEKMAERNRGVFLEAPQMHPMMADGNQSVLVGMFNYMIANLDWSAVFFHNAVVIRLEDGRHLTVPYDFDFAGVINARYAVVPEQLRDEKIQEAVGRTFAEIKAKAQVHNYLTGESTTGTAGGAILLDADGERPVVLASLPVPVSDVDGLGNSDPGERADALAAKARGVSAASDSRLAPISAAASPRMAIMEREAGTDVMAAW